MGRISFVLIHPSNYISLDDPEVLFLIMKDIIGVGGKGSASFLEELYIVVLRRLEIMVETATLHSP